VHETEVRTLSASRPHPVGTVPTVPPVAPFEMSWHAYERAREREVCIQLQKLQNARVDAHRCMRRLRRFPAQVCVPEANVNAHALKAHPLGFPAVHFSTSLIVDGDPADSGENTGAVAAVAVAMATDVHDAQRAEPTGLKELVDASAHLCRVRVCECARVSV
jgi:hypothetical protein